MFTTIHNSKFSKLFAERLLQTALMLAISLSIFQLWQGASSWLPSTYLRPIHLTWVLILALLFKPLLSDTNHPLFTASRYTDAFLSILALWIGYKIVVFDYNQIDHMLNGLQPDNLLAGICLIVLLLEAARRTVGLAMTLIGSAFIIYTIFGSYFPGVLEHKGFSLERMVRFQVYTASGIFGPALGIAASTVFIFVLFGALLEITGAGKFFIDLAYAGFGKYRGGPAKAAVVASAALGSISGSAIANTATSGVITIPMMKKVGYRPEQAAGIEAAASTGGQIMPPIMGAGAFIMAKFTNVPYNDIVWMAIAPAILYFFSTLLYVHLMACKLNLKGEINKPNTWQTFFKNMHFIFPLVLITALLLMNYSPTLVAIAGCIAIVTVAFMRRHTWISFTKLLEGMKKGAVMALPVSIACATAGIVVGTIGQTGLGLQFTELVISFANGQLWLALVLVALCALILGLGLPVTAAYIVIAIMTGPALGSMGLSLIAANMVIFWLSQSSNVTPPIALAAFTAAGIANSRPMATAISAFKLSQGLFIIPLMMVYSDLLYTDKTNLTDFISAISQTVALIISFAIAIEGYCFTKMGRISRLLSFAAGIAIFVSGYYASLIGIIMLTAILGNNYYHSRKLRISTGQLSTHREQHLYIDIDKN